MSRPAYPRTQYASTRAHVTLDHQQPPSHQPPSEVPGYASSSTAQHYEHAVPAGGYGQTGSYTAGVAVVPPPLTADGAKRPPGHPLKSFSVPAPPPTSAPGTPQPKHVVSPAHVVRAGGSPYKKLQGSPSRISSTNPPPHTAEEVQRLAPSRSTEELNQEMANLEGLMKDLSAITASQFEC